MTTLVLWFLTLASNPVCVTPDAAWDNYGSDYSDYCPMLETPSQDQE